MMNVEDPEIERIILLAEETETEEGGKVEESPAMERMRRIQAT